MTVSFWAELRFLGFAFLFGVFCGIYYDVFRFLRALLGRRKALCTPSLPHRIFYISAVLIRDFLCIVLLGVLYVLFLYETHDGIFRFYSLFSLSAGILLYEKTIGRWILIFFRRTAFWIRKFLSFLFYPVFCIYRNIFCPISRYFKQKTLSFLTRCVKIKGKKSRKTVLATNQKTVKKEPYGKTKRV